MNPKFSIIIPTKNRPLVIRGAIGSCLRQTCGDLEVIVVDNDDGDGALKRVVEEFQDKRLRYVRTGGLSHADNWEAGWRHATGDCVTLLHDKAAFRDDAIETIASVQDKHPGACVLWRSDFLCSLNCEPGHPVLFTSRVSGQAIPYSNRDCLRRVTSLPYPGWEHMLPVISHAMVPRHYLEQIASGPCGRVFSDVPDFSQAYRLLATCENYVLCDRSLAVGCDQGGSTAAQFDLGSQSVSAKEKFQDDHLFSHVPVKIMHTRNMILNQYHLIREEVGGVLTEFPLPLDAYYVSLVHGLIDTAYGDGNVTRGHLLAWANSLNAQEPELRTRVFASTGSILLPFILQASVVPLDGVSAYERLMRVNRRTRELKAEVSELKSQMRLLKQSFKAAEKDVPTLGSVARATLRRLFRRSTKTRPSNEDHPRQISTEPGAEPSAQDAPLFAIDVVKAAVPPCEVRMEPAGTPLGPLSPPAQ